MFNECGAGPNFLFAHALLLEFASLQTNADSIDIKIEIFHFKELYLSISDGIGKYNCLPPMLTTATIYKIDWYVLRNHFLIMIGPTVFNSIPPSFCFLSLAYPIQMSDFFGGTFSGAFFPFRSMKFAFGTRSQEKKVKEVSIMRMDAMAMRTCLKLALAHRSSILWHCRQMFAFPMDIGP